jgi:deazaflavin-dependent oxidoreductase (nitroreductase family)
LKETQMTDEDEQSTYEAPNLALFGEEHVRKYQETDGAIGYEWNGATCLLLTTTGRKSGEKRTLPLIFATSGRSCVIIASNGGAPTDPAWYLNIEADPHVEVQVKGERFSAVARTASGDERQALWRLMTVDWPNYDEYTKRTDRTIPVVVLDREE